MLDVFLQPAFWAGLVLLIGMDLILSSDNMRSVSTMSGSLPPDHRERVVRIAMALTAVFRLVLLFGVVWVLDVDRLAFSIAGWAPNWGQVLMAVGGLFLVFKAVTEIHGLIEPASNVAQKNAALPDGLFLAVAQIVAIHSVLSVDSVIMAIGLAPYVEAMAIGLVASLAILYFFSERIESFLLANPAIRALAMALLLMVGTLLVARGLGMDVWQPYLYAAMVFAVLVMIVGRLIRTMAGGGAEEAVTAPAPDHTRQEPSLDPEPRVDGHEFEPVMAHSVSIEPDIMETVEPLLEPELVPTAIESEDDPLVPDQGYEPEIEDLAPEIILSEIELDTDEVFLDEDGDAPLGEPLGTVQKSRPKRTRIQRRPPRLRTGSRK